MKVMVIVKATNESEAGKMPSPELMDAMGNFNQQLVEAGIMESGDGLKPTSAGYRVRFSGDKRITTQGPFLETNELIAGYWVWNVSSMQEALEWVHKCPNPMTEDSDIEIRPFYSMEDFAEVDATGEFAAKEQGLINKMAMQKATLNNYLFFSGHCEDAIRFYEKHLGANVSMLMRFSDCPEPIPAEMLEPGFENNIMHCEFTIGDSKFFASDGCNSDAHKSGFSLAITLKEEEQVRRVFNALAEDGEVTMPLNPTFWSPLYGQVVDEFGLAWMIMQADNNLGH